MDKSKTVRSLSFFSGLSDAEVELIASKLIEKVFPLNSIIIEQEQPSDSVYFIYKGAGQIYRITQDGNYANIALCGPGDIIGEMGLIDNMPRSANVKAIQETHVLMLRKEDFVNILKQNPSLSINLLKVFSQRLRNNDLMVEDVLSKNLTERTWKAIEALGKFFPNREINLSQEELAEIVGATRARITEALNLLQNEGKISLSHRKIQICSPKN